MDKLEDRVLELAQLTEKVEHASDLYSKGYEPKHQTMRKQVGDFVICYRQREDGLFEFAALMKYNYEE